MQEIVVRPTLKFIHASYAVEVLLLAAAFAGPWWWLPALPGCLILWTVVRHIGRRAMKITITADKLRCEIGMLSKSTRTIQLAKVQDVRVDQSIGQRLLRVGSLAIETAGESSRLSVPDIDRPQDIADEIIRRSELAVKA